MKKLLVLGASAGVMLAAAPAMAQIDVTVGGHTKNYIGWMDQDTAVNQDARNFDMIRESELHFNAEGTADNGLTYGFHVEMEVDGGDSGTTLEESYLYLSSNMGRINAGSEDGAAYLLQVAAPSADSNIDGIRQYINPVNYTTAIVGAGSSAVTAANNAVRAAAVNGTTFDGFDYDNDQTGFSEKLTYLSPVWSGFQFGASYTPDITNDNGSSTGLAGFNADNATAANNFKDAWEGAARYEGTFNNVGFALGGGYTHVDNDTTTVASDDLKEWNVGADFDIGAFGIGAVYTTNNGAVDTNGDSDTWVVGVDYTTGPFQLGASYFNNNTETGAASDVDTDRYTGGVIYTAAPGLSFRGSVSHIKHDATGQADQDATSVLGGVQLNF